MIVGPDDWAGRDLRQLSQWKADLPRPDALAATLLRRAIYVSGVRRQPDNPGSRATDYGTSMLAACYTHQPSRAHDAVRRPGWREDFAQPGRTPLEGFDAAALRDERLPEDHRLRRLRDRASRHSG